MEATLTKEEKMKSLLKLMFIVSFTASLLTACIVSPGPGGYGVSVAPALPTVVELDVSQPYYYQSGYHYYYQNNYWQYSTEKNGPRMELPRSHWPKEIRYKGRGERGGAGRHERDHDDHERR
jgi:hypothetical protein